MTDHELQKILNSVRGPEWETGYWTNFAPNITARLRRQSFRLAGNAQPIPRVKLAPLGWRFVIGFAAILVVFTFGFWKTRDLFGSKDQLAAAQKYANEFEALFPGQIRAIILDDGGPHLLLSDRTDVPPSPPVYLKVCQERTCQRIVTFSGQEIQVGHAKCEVLTDSKGNVLLVGDSFIWSSLNPRSGSSPYRIEGRQLQTLL
jgi:hypothetical protein